jgi:tetratricopeptide (TPR) repeat protein
MRFAAWAGMFCVTAAALLAAPPDRETILDALRTTNDPRLWIAWQREIAILPREDPRRLYIANGVVQACGEIAWRSPCGGPTSQLAILRAAKNMVQTAEAVVPQGDAVFADQMLVLARHLPHVGEDEAAASILIAEQARERLEIISGKNSAAALRARLDCVRLSAFQRNDGSPELKAPSIIEDAARLTSLSPDQHRALILEASEVFVEHVQVFAHYGAHLDTYRDLQKTLPQNPLERITQEVLLVAFAPQDRIGAEVLQLEKRLENLTQIPPAQKARLLFRLARTMMFVEPIAANRIQKAALAAVPTKLARNEALELWPAALHGYDRPENYRLFDAQAAVELDHWSEQLEALAPDRPTYASVAALLAAQLYARSKRFPDATRCFRFAADRTRVNFPQLLARRGELVADFLFAGNAFSDSIPIYETSVAIHDVRNDHEASKRILTRLATAYDLAGRKVEADAARIRAASKSGGASDQPARADAVNTLVGLGAFLIVPSALFFFSRHRLYNRLESQFAPIQQNDPLPTLLHTYSLVQYKMSLKGRAIPTQDEPEG